jgi:pimeloyl-ACP methyl ester carboxylesterase
MTFDHRGVGSSVSAQGRISIARLALDVRELTDESRWDRFHLLGISMGGMVAQAVARDAPGLGALILGCTTHGGLDSEAAHPEFLALCASWSDSDVAAQRAFAERFVAFSFTDAFLRSKASNVTFRFSDAFLGTTRSEAGLAAQLDAIAAFNSTSWLSCICVPTLVIHGSEDRVLAPHNGRSLASKIKFAEYLELCGAGHFWWAHRPAEVARKIMEFLKAHDRPTDLSGNLKPELRDPLSGHGGRADM